MELKAGDGCRKVGRGGPSCVAEGKTRRVRACLLTREALCTVLVSAEVVVLVPSGERQGEAAGREGGGTQFAGHGRRELQAVGCVFTTQVDWELQ